MQKFVHNSLYYQKREIKMQVCCRVLIILYPFGMRTGDSPEEGYLMFIGAIYICQRYWFGCKATFNEYKSTLVIYWGV